MKKVLSLVLALTLVLGMIPVFAAETGTDKLVAAGFVNGNNPEDVLTREQLAVLVTQLNGEEAVAEAVAWVAPLTFADADKITWSKGYVGYAVAEGWMTGKTGNMFDPQAPATPQQVAAVLLNALEYEVGTDVEYANVLEFAAGLGLNIAAGTQMTRGEAFEAMWVAVAEVPMNTEEGKTLGVVLGKLTEEEPEVVALAVESVTATNLKEVVVTFNNELDKDTVVAANFVLNKSLTSGVTLLEDGKTVVVAVTPVATGSMANQTEYTLTIEKVKDTAGSELAKVTQAFTAFDATLPTVVGVKYTGPKSFEIEFSEPMKTNPTVTVKAGNSSLSVNTGAITGLGTNVITVPLFSTLTDATTYSINITGSTDFAGYVNVIKTVEAPYAKDTTAPTASVVKATQEYVLVEFSKPVSGLDAGLFSHTFTAWKASKLTATDSYAAASATSGTKFYVWFNGAGNASIDRPIAQGTTTLNILAKTTTPAAEIVDLWGNKFAEATLTLSVVADTTAPEVKEVKVTAETAMTVEFTKNVSFAAANVEILDKDGKAITGVAPSVVEASGVKKYTVKFGKNLAGETLIVNIKNVKDTTLMTNAMPAYTTTITVTDKTAPAIDKVTYDATDKYLYVFFTENMDSATTLVKDNFQLVNGTTYTKLATDPVFVNGSKTVRFTLNTTQQALITLNTTTVLVDNVKDVALNTITAKMSTAVVAHAGAVVPTFSKAEATATNKVVVTFDSELALIDIAAFEINNVAPVAMEVAVVEGKTVATFTLNDANKLAANYVNNAVAVDYAGANQAAQEASVALIKNLFNVSPAWNATVNVADKIAPTVAAADIVTASGQITLTFSENLSVTVDPSSFAQDLVITKNGTAMVAGVDYKTALAGAVITVTKVDGSDLDDAVYSVKSVAAPLYIRDTQANKAVAFTTAKELTVDQTAPTSTIVSAVYDESDNTITITGTNFTTAATAGTDIKALVDWTKFVWDINGDNAVTANVTFVAGDITSAVVTNATTLTITLTTVKGAALEGTAGYGAAGNADTLDVTAGFIIDAYGNVSTTDAVADGVITVQA